MDRTILGYFRGALVSHSEPSDDNCRLMVECLVSEVLEAGRASAGLFELLGDVVRDYPETSVVAKAAYVGQRRLNGEISKQQFAVLDYDDIQVTKAPKKLR